MRQVETIERSEAYARKNKKKRSKKKSKKESSFDLVETFKSLDMFGQGFKFNLNGQE